MPEFSLGGVSTVLIQYLQELDKKKYDVEFMLSSNENMFFKDNIPKDIKLNILTNKNVKKLILILEKKILEKNRFLDKASYKILLFIEEKIRMTKIRKSIKKNDVFIDFFGGRSLVVEAVKKLEIERVLWLHTNPEYLVLKLDDERILKYNKIISICEEMERLAININKNIKDKIFTIYNFLNEEEIIRKSKLELKTLEDQRLVKQDYFIHVSRLDKKHKDFETLIKGFSIYIKNGGESLLYILGNGVDELEIKKMIISHNLEDKVLMLGAQKNPYIWIKNSKALILSSHYEGFGMVLLEALILGKNIISSKCKVGPEEIIGNQDKNGYLFDVGNSEELANILINFKEKDIDIIKFKKQNSLRKFDELFYNI